MPEFPLHGSAYFDVREFVDERTWRALGGAKAASMIDPRIVRIADRLRELAGPIVVNNWHYAKPGQKVYRSSGFRAVWDKTGGDLSQHRRGGAADFKSKTLPPPALHALILSHADEFRALGLTCMEDLAFTPTWLHCDCRELVGEWKDFAKPFLIVRP